MECAQEIGLIDHNIQSDRRLIVESDKILSTTDFGLSDTSDAAVMVSTQRCTELHGLPAELF
jgi:hypothetical protein